ncbi:hypothetical protein DQ04_03701090 [Trypanosoma grayi]|uniref:hypothetical protein n=1 Tax=Trypanosoma grayi TaxID=71804 RepID=UPI0004F4171E|nr:hypothetical protein DQ04_03701090 [Trypanosoma grayi]KEG10453.1 hypothetical protein DQ04_03701090 [Trypanosoma grayi]
MPLNYYQLKQRLMVEYNGTFIFSDSTRISNVAEQVRRFYDADVVIGPHGANLANVMWMRHGTHVIEIMSYTYGNMCYYNTASVVNVTHHAIFHKRGKDDPYTLLYDDLQRHVDYAVNALRIAF